MARHTFARLKFFVPYAIPTDAYQGDFGIGSDNGFARERAALRTTGTSMRMAGAGGR